MQEQIKSQDKMMFITFLVEAFLVHCSFCHELSQVKIWTLDGNDLVCGRCAANLEQTS